VKIEGARTETPDVSIRNYRYRTQDFLFVLRHAAAPLPPMAPVTVPRPEVLPPEEGAPVEPPDVPAPHGPPAVQQLYQVAPVPEPPVKPEPALPPDQPPTPAPAVPPVPPVAPVTPVTPAPVEEKPPVLKGDFLALKLDRERCVYNIVEGRFLGKTASPLVFLSDGECTALALLDYEVKSVDVNVTVRPQELSYRLMLRTAPDKAQVGLHTFRLEFLDPKGAAVPWYTTVVPAPQGVVSGVFGLAINEATGEWTLRVTDTLTGAKGEAKFAIK
jgi:hypothetical protein